jgi:hypothetical protein
MTTNSTPIVNLPKVAQEVEKFYLSGKQTGKLTVDLNAPVNDDITVNLNREKNFSLTLKNALKPVQLHLSNITQLTDGKQKFVASSGEQRQHLLKSFAHKAYQKYLTVNNTTGAMSFTNNKPHRTVFIQNGKCNTKK